MIRSLPVFPHMSDILFAKQNMGALLNDLSTGDSLFSQLSLG